MASLQQAYGIMLVRADKAVGHTLSGCTVQTGLGFFLFPAGLARPLLRAARAGEILGAAGRRFAGGLRAGGGVPPSGWKTVRRHARRRAFGPGIRASRYGPCSLSGPGGFRRGEPVLARWKPCEHHATVWPRRLRWTVSRIAMISRRFRPLGAPWPPTGVRSPAGQVSRTIPSCRPSPLRPSTDNLSLVAHLISLWA